MEIQEAIEQTDTESIHGLGQQGENLSIMIANYNGAKTIAETIASILAVGERIAKAEIVVVDNASTDDSEEVVRLTGQNRVRFHRNEVNVGAFPNFNLCYELAQNEWVHLVHSDDTVIDTAYEEFERCLNLGEGVTAVFTRAAVCDEKMNWVSESPLLGPQTRGIYVYCARHWASNPVHFIAALISQTAHRNIGGFDHRVTEYSADMEYYWRIAKNCAVAYANVCSGKYRVSGFNSTSKLYRSGKNISTWATVLNMVWIDYQENKQGSSKLLPYEIYRLASNQAISQTLDFLRVRDLPAFRANWDVIVNLPRAGYSRRAKLQLLSQIILHLPLAYLFPRNREAVSVSAEVLKL